MYYYNLGDFRFIVEGFILLSYLYDLISVIENLLVFFNRIIWNMRIDGVLYVYMFWDFIGLNNNVCVEIDYFEVVIDGIICFIDYVCNLFVCLWYFFFVVDVCVGKYCNV